MAGIGVVLTAGGRVPRAKFADAPHVVTTDPDDEAHIIKALLKVGERTLLEVALDAVLPIAKDGGDVVIVGSPALERWFHQPMVRLVPEKQEAHENLIAGLEAVADYPRVLYLTTDLPFVTAESVRQFVEKCPPDADLCYAIVRREVFDQRFPNSPSIYARLRDGEYVAGCAAVVNPNGLLQRTEWIRRVAQRRKSLWRLALLAGVKVMWRYAIGHLTVKDVERRAEQLLGMRCRAVEGPPELAYDVDTPEDYLYALRLSHVGPQ